MDQIKENMKETFFIIWNWLSSTSCLLYASTSFGLLRKLVNFVAWHNDIPRPPQWSELHRVLCFVRFCESVKLNLNHQRAKESTGMCQAWMLLSDEGMGWNFRSIEVLRKFRIHFCCHLLSIHLTSSVFSADVSQGRPKCNTRHSWIWSKLNSHNRWNEE